MKKRTLLSLLMIAVALCAFGEAVQAIPGLSRFKLANGLEIYGYRDAAVPLARVRIVFRTGAISQQPETAGLFHLYEHMLFRGSASHPGAAGVKAALSSLGASECNGGTGAERVDYWITLPSSELQKALAFWADLFESPALDVADLEAEKDVVIQEIKSRTGDPEAIYQSALDRKLFAKYPWTRDPAGSEKAIRGATVASLKALAATWFVPNNAAVFVGGDIEPDSLLSEAQAAFGGWAAGPDPWPKGPPQSPRPGVSRPTWMVLPDPAMPEGIGSVEARYRGPDLAFDPASSYAADLWCALVAPPGGRFKKALEANVPKLGGPDGIVAEYVSQRAGGWISISSYFVVDPALPAAERGQAFKERERAFEITTMKGDPAYFSPDEYDAARKRVLDYRAMETDDAEGMIDALGFWWAAASVDYFSGYPAALAKIGPKEIAAFLDTYVMRNLEVVAIRMNPADYEKEKPSFANSGFETISPANAFWWQK